MYDIGGRGSENLLLLVTLRSRMLSSALRRLTRGDCMQSLLLLLLSLFLSCPNGWCGDHNGW